MMVRRIYMILFLILALVGNAAAQSVDPPVSKIEAIVELPKEKPYVGEPLRLILRSAIHAQVASERIYQPELTDFDWQQFGVDTFSNEFIDGFWMPVLTRVLMIYPLRPGQLTINSFKRHITYYAFDGARTEIELVSKPISIDVISREVIADQGNFWIPAKSLRISDQWEPEPDKIRFGETAKRILTVEAEGLTADRLPNLPNFRAPGIITFAGPIERQTIITDQGPVGRARYQWHVRPVAMTAATAPSIRLKWFDISARVMREAVAPERQVAFSQNKKVEQRSKSDLITILFSSSSLYAYLLAFAFSCAIWVMINKSNSFKTHGWRYLMQKAQLFLLLLIKALQNKTDDFYYILMKLRALDKPFHHRILAQCNLTQELTKLEHSLFGPSNQRESYSLAPLAFKLISTAVIYKR